MVLWVGTYRCWGPLRRSSVHQVELRIQKAIQYHRVTQPSSSFVISLAPQDIARLALADKALKAIAEGSKPVAIMTRNDRMDMRIVPAVT